MCVGVADALRRRRHLVVEAPTGVGKSYAIAVAVAHHLAMNAGDTPLDLDDDAPGSDEEPDNDEHAEPPPDRRRVVVTTATRALQDQLVEHDLPTVAAALEPLGAGFTFSVLKGRSNYLCLARAAEATGALLDEDRDLAVGMIAEAEALGDGERTRLDDVSDDAWRLVSVGSDECPGARSCSVGDRCWAEVAKRRAAQSDVVVVNTALYAAHLLAEGAVLPDHEAVVVDEAHALADIIVDASSVRISAGRLRAVERLTRAFGGKVAGGRLTSAADGLRDSLGDTEAEVDPTEGDLAVHLADARAAASELARLATESGGDEAMRAASAAANLARDVDVVVAGDDVDRVVWTDGSGNLLCAPVEADDLARQYLWPTQTVVCTSATLRGAGRNGERSFAPLLAALGAPVGTDTLAVDSPFDHRTQALLYVPKDRIPSPRETGWSDGVVDELWDLAVAAGGRTLALFTSRAATERAAAALRERGEALDDPIDVLTQWDASRQRLVDALESRRRVVLCATRSFWTGIDIPGDACVVVAIDRLPFPRPDDPRTMARRRAAEERGANPFLTVDVPIAATQLAQGVGRLIRTIDDRGVVAILDTRLATARWRNQILAALPDLRRTIDPGDVAAFLADA